MVLTMHIGKYTWEFSCCH